MTGKSKLAIEKYIFSLYNLMNNFKGSFDFFLAANNPRISYEEKKGSQAADIGL